MLWVLGFPFIEFPVTLWLPSHTGEILVGQVPESIVRAKHPEPAAGRLDRAGTDHAIDAESRPTADNNTDGYALHV
jgi:hypothetical protein